MILARFLTAKVVLHIAWTTEGGWL